MGGSQRDHALSFLARPWFYAISDGTGKPGAATLAAAAHAGAQILQVREKQLSTRELLEYCRELRVATAGTGTRILVNERWDVAVGEGLDGVHLPAAGATAAQVRRHVPPAFLIAVSCHGAAEVASTAGADLAVLGPIFVTPSKLAYGPPLGLEVLRAACAGPLPVVALGGVTPENAGACLAAGAAGVAGIRLFQSPAAVAALVAGTRPSETA